MMSLVFSKSTPTKSSNVITSSNITHINTVSITKTMTPTNSETIYYMQNSMIGRLMNVKPCNACHRQ